MDRYFWDIETLDNVFTIAVWCPDGYLDERNPTLVFYVLPDDDTLMPAPDDELALRNFIARLYERVKLRVPVMGREFRDFGIVFADLRNPADVARLIRMVGIGSLSRNQNLQQLGANLFDDEGRSIAWYDGNDFPFDFEDPDAPLLLGYNSYNYDTTILARYIAAVCGLDAYDGEPASDALQSQAAQIKVKKEACEKLRQTSRYFDEKRELDECVRKYNKALEEERDRVRKEGIKTDRITAHELRHINDLMFSPLFIDQMPQSLTLNVEQMEELARSATYQIPMNQKNYNRSANRLRDFWLKSGRHIDVAKLNEKQFKVGLKRQLGVIGRQIFESEAVRGSEPLTGGEDALLDLLAYNVSDVVNLQFLYEDGNYEAPAQNKKMIIDTYAESVFKPSIDDANHAPGQPVAINTTRDREHLRFRRLTLDSTSQQIISTVLAPTSRAKCGLPDSPVVTLEYPSENMAKLEGIPRRDILDETNDFFRNRVLPRVTDPYWHEVAERQWVSVQKHYEWIRGKNFNDSEHHLDIHGDETNPYEPQYHQLPGIGTNIIYFDGDGNPTSYYATFSEGGVHGAEYNLELYLADKAGYEMACAVIEQAKSIFGDGDDGALNMRVNGVNVASRDYIMDADGNEIVFVDGRRHHVADLLKSGFTSKAARWREFTAPRLFIPSTLKVNNLKANPCFSNFPFDDVDVTTLNPRYAYTSAAHVNHEDFASYYPGLIRRMEAFLNEDLGYDRYGELYNQKQTFGAYQKNPDCAPDELKPVRHLPDGSVVPMDRDEASRHWKRRRDGVKLMLNAGSGAGDAKFDNPIRMNNKIIAMRMIGQMFTWRVGQAQALLGAGVPSTNTDGLYTIMEASRNNEILERESAGIGVEIEPEEMDLISKDANNRIEFQVRDQTATDDESMLIDRFKILSAGGSLSCYRGPDTSKSIAHPAIYDWGLSYYLMNIYENMGQSALSEPFDADLMRRIIDTKLAHIATEEEQVHILRMFMVMRASSPKKFTYPVARHIDETGSTTTESLCQHYSRVMFINADNAPELVRNGFDACYLRHATAKVKQPKQNIEPDGEAMALLRTAGHTSRELDNENRVPTFAKIPGIAIDQACVIENSDLYVMDPARRMRLIEALDIDTYIDEMRDIYETNWRNAPGAKQPWDTLLQARD